MYIVPHRKVDIKTVVDYEQYMYISCRAVTRVLKCHMLVNFTLEVPDELT